MFKLSRLNNFGVRTLRAQQSIDSLCEQAHRGHSVLPYAGWNHQHLQLGSCEHYRSFLKTAVDIEQVAMQYVTGVLKAVLCYQCRLLKKCSLLSTAPQALGPPHWSPSLPATARELRQGQVNSPAGQNAQRSMHTMQARANPAQHISSRPLLPGLQTCHRGNVRCAAEQPEQRRPQPSALDPMTFEGDMAFREVMEIRLAVLEEKRLADEAQVNKPP